MNKIHGLLAAFLVTLTAMSITAEPVRAHASLDAALQPYLARYGLPALAAAVTVKGDTVAAGAVGTRRVGSDIPVTLNDRFHIGSDTKAMTALLAAMMVEEGKLRWAATPAELFPEFAAEMDPGFAAVTLEQILSHSSGLPSDNDEIGAVWQEALLQDGNLDAMRLHVVRQWGKRPLASSPGKRFAYSNMGYVVAGAMIERAAGKTWDELMVERIFVPLGLNTAGLGCQASLGKVDAPLGHVLADGTVQAALAGPNGDNPSLIGPAGIAHMSILDFARWASWNAGEGKRGPVLVTAQTMRKLHTPVVSMPSQDNGNPGAPASNAQYALGWGVVKIGKDKHPILQHAGSNTKNLAMIWVDTKHDVAMVLATNIAGKKATEALETLAKELHEKYAPLK